MFSPFGASSATFFLLSLHLIQQRIEPLEAAFPKLAVALQPFADIGERLGVEHLLLGLALKALPIGTAYAVWTGIGAAGTAVIGMAFLGDTVSTIKLVSIGLVLAGVVGLNLSGVTP